MDSINDILSSLTDEDMENLRARPRIHGNRISVFRGGIRGDHG